MWLLDPVNALLDEHRRSANSSCSFDDPTVAISGPLPSGRQMRSLLTRSPKSIATCIRPSAPLVIVFAARVTTAFSNSDCALNATSDRSPAAKSADVTTSSVCSGSRVISVHVFVSYSATDVAFAFP